MRRMLLVVSVAAVILVGCGDHRVARGTATATLVVGDVQTPSRDRTPTPTRTATQSPTPVPSAGPPPAIVREVVEAALARDEERFRSLISWTEVPCLRPDPKATDVVGPTPLCSPEDATGAPYRVAYYSSTHGVRFREEELMRYLPAGFLGTEVHVEGAAPRSPACCWNGDEKYVVGISTKGGGLFGRAVFRVFLDDRGIVRFHVYTQPMDDYRPLFELN